MAVLFSYELDNDRSTRALFGMEISQLLEDERLAWVHLDLTAADVHEWLKTNVSYLGESLISALLADETRPRISNHGNGMLLILRGVNSNENSDPEDMVSTRLWIDEHRIISIQKRNLSAIDDVVKDIQQGHGPENSAEFLVMLTQKLMKTTASEVEIRTIQVDQIEDEVFDHGKVSPPEKISLERRKNIILQRFLRPQKEVLNPANSFPMEWVKSENRAALFETYQGYLKISEDLDLNTERLRVAEDEITKYNHERLNNNMYRLSILSAVFLPLGFLTGLFGINIAGMPGVSAPHAFIVFCTLLLVIFGLQLLVLKRLKWF
jgi:zinc transporter